MLPKMVSDEGKRPTFIGKTHAATFRTETVDFRFVVCSGFVELERGVNWALCSSSLSCCSMQKLLEWHPSRRKGTDPTASRSESTLLPAQMLHCCNPNALLWMIVAEKIRESGPNSSFLSCLFPWLAVFWRSLKCSVVVPF